MSFIFFFFLRLVYDNKQLPNSDKLTTESITWTNVPTVPLKGLDKKVKSRHPLQRQSLAFIMGDSKLL